MSSESPTNHSIAAVALALSLLALGMSVFSLMATDPASILDRLGAILGFLFGKSASQIVTNLPIIRLYAELWPVYLVFIVFLSTITYYEFKEQIIPDAVTIPGIVIGMGFVAGFRHISLMSAVFAVGIAFGGLWAINAYWLRTHRKIGMAAGDVKMLAMIGAFLGVQNLLIVLMLASILATIYLKVFARRSFAQYIEFGPWLAIAALICAFVPVSELLFR